MVKAAEEGGTRSVRIQLELSRTSGLCLGITRHLRDKPHALFVRQPSAAESCKKMGRWRRKIDVSMSARRRHFTASNWRAPKKEQQQQQQRFWSRWKHIEENLQMEKPASKHTRLFQPKMLTQNGTTGQIRKFSHGKSLTVKELQWAMRIESRRWTAGAEGE